MTSLRIALHVTPKSGRDEVAGWRGGELSVRVTAAPEGGKATAAACAVLARALGVPKSSVQVVRGETSRHKQVLIDDVTSDDVTAAFGTPEGTLF
ncbi:MAG: DUF167 domain-containing protein [Actinobacteria bacterium]|nr:DUF167 domain-containing protein [Actinomycetota bacterium]MCG2808045.1 DUF167 domain-containing protein [Coriobacteriia bacterium]